MADALKVAIVGSRDYPDLEAVADYVKALAPGTTIITGGARGVDRVAEVVGRQIGLRVIVVRPDYEKYGRAAPLIRNGGIVRLADTVAAFWDGKSTGTSDAITKARAADRKVEIHYAQRGAEHG